VRRYSAFHRRRPHRRQADRVRLAVSSHRIHWHPTRRRIRLPGRSWLSGTELHPDKGGKIVNWPQQNYNNGCTKDYASGEQFKTITRIIKRMRYELIDEGHEVAERIPSFLIECLVYGIPNDQLNVGSLKQNVRSMLVYLWNGTETQPLYWRNDYVAVEQWSRFIRDDHYAFHTGLHRQHEEFAKMWDKNLRSQGFAEAFERQQQRA
jgi:hypothetical protein